MIPTSLVNKILLLLYIIVPFVPEFGTQDRANAQWFYVAIINFIAITYIFLNKKEYNFSFPNKIVLYIFLGSILFFIIGTLSMTKALLISESIVALMYFVLTVLSFIVLFFIVKQNPKEYFDFFVLLIIASTLIEINQVCGYFFERNGEPRTNELVAALKDRHGYGNPNILAASIAMKFPFLIYGFLTFKNGLAKYGVLFVFLFLIVSLLLVGARTAVFSSTIFLICMLIYFLIKEKDKLKVIKQKLLPLILVVSAGLFISLNVNRIEKTRLNPLKMLFFTKSKKALFRKASKIKEVTLTNSSGRDALWESAYLGFKNSPLLGIGLGNWKLTEKKTFLNSITRKTAMSPKRVHNDFLQLLSEVGVFGFLIFLTFFAILFYISIKSMIQNNGSEEKRDYTLMIGVVLISFLIYSLDALFNFPHERTPIQMFFAILIAFILAFSFFKENVSPKKGILFSLLFLFSFGSLFVSYKVFSASRVYKVLQDNFNKKDMLKDKFDISYEEACEMLPNFPQINGRGRPNSIIKSIFAINQKKYNKALEHLEVSFNEHPFIAENNSFAALIYFQGDKDIRDIESSLYYAERAFEIQPSMKIGYNILRNIYTIRKDTVSMLKTFDTFLKTVPKDVDSWMDKANYLKKIGVSNDKIIKVIDSARILNPYNRKLKIYSDEFKAVKKQTKGSTDEIVKYFKLGEKYYKLSKFNDAKKEFLEVLKINPMHFSGMLYLGLTEAQLKEYENAIYYFTKVIEAKQVNNGYLEYNRGIAYYQLGKREKALSDFNVSLSRGYTQAEKMIKQLNFSSSVK